LLKARVVIHSYNDHVRLLSPSLGLVSATKSTRVEEPALLWNHSVSSRRVSCCDCLIVFS
jgi:hypothetical protein